jgi:hypothetical protein
MMSVVEPGTAGAGLFARAKDILLKPGATWEVIDREPATIGGLYRSYVMPLAAIPAVATLVGFLVFGMGVPGLVTFRPNPVWLVVQSLISYGLTLAMCYVLALVIEALAPNFGGVKDRVQAFKVAAYAPTAAWVAGIFGLVPMLGILALVGALYSLFLLHKGLPKLMKTPEDKALPYTAVVIVVAIVIALVMSAITGSVMAMTGALNPTSMGAMSGTVKVPGGTMDLGKLEEASKRMEAAAKQAEAGTTTVADPEALKAYLPASVAGFTRDEVSASSSGAAGIQGSEAEARYTKGEARLRLQVTDLGAAGALAGMASAFNVKSSKETATGYEKVGMVGGRMTQESYDRSAKSGEYSVLVGERFMVQASGDGVSMDELKAAVEAVGPARLESLAKAG